MDKRRNHIIFWVGYFLYYFLSNYSVTHYNRPNSYITFFTLVTVLFTIPVFYFLANYLYPLFIPTRKYFQLVSCIFLLGTVLLLLFCSLILFVSYHFEFPAFNTIRVERISFYFLIRYISILYISPIYWYMKQYIRNEEESIVIREERNNLQKTVIQADLLGLKNQINPHFLYNILNFFYSQSLPISKKLSGMILSLSKMMRYAIKENAQDGKVTIDEELEYLKSYSELELAESGGKFGVKFNIEGSLKYRRLKPLTLLPFVEVIFMFGETNSDYIIEIKVENNNLLLTTNYHKSKAYIETHFYGYINQYNKLLIKEYGNQFNLNVESSINDNKMCLRLNL
jgi:two-component system LytT family sensor kinase